MGAGKVNVNRLKGKKMRARKSDPVTSHEAGASVKSLSETKKGILGILMNRPMSDGELWNEYYWLARKGKLPYASESGVRSRRAELVASGFVESVGFDTTKFGRRTLVWGLKRG